MGFKSAKNTSNVNQSNIRYKVANIIFPSRFVYSTIKSIHRNLKFFYSPAPPDKIWSTINYSAVREDEEEFNCILDRVEERIERFDEEVEIIETDDAAFNKKFHGIIDFLYEACDFENNKEDELSKQTPEYIKKRFINLASRLWELGIHPCEF